MTRRIMGILLLLILKVSLTAVSVSAAPKGGTPHKQAYNLGNCKSVCEGWYQQRYCDDGHWGPYFHWVCYHWSTRRACSYWAWKCTGPTP